MPSFQITELLSEINEKCIQLLNDDDKGCIHLDALRLQKGINKCNLAIIALWKTFSPPIRFQFGS